MDYLRKLNVKKTFRPKCSMQASDLREWRIVTWKYLLGYSIITTTSTTCWANPGFGNNLPPAAHIKGWVVSSITTNSITPYRNSTLPVHSKELITCIFKIIKIALKLGLLISLASF